MQTTFICHQCQSEFSPKWPATTRKKLRDKGYVYCSTSCASFKHGGYKNKMPEYVSWHAMKTRCDNPTHRAYARYGGRGISYDPRWAEFKNFLDDMGLKPDPKMELDRIDNEKNYSKENCKWSTREEQTRNRGGKRATRLYTYAGKTMCIKDWADYVGISPQSMQKRLNKGWSLERAFTKKEN